MTTGSDILNYRGQPELAGGYSDNSVLQQGKELNGIDNVLQNLMAQNAQQNLNIYAQKIRDRDDTLKAIAENKIDYTNLDDIYRKGLEKQLTDIQQARVKTPDIMSNPKAYAELQNNITKFQQRAAYAKANSAELKKLDLDYANNPDPQYRQRLGSFIADQRQKASKDPNYQIQPYHQIVGFGPEDFGYTNNTVSTITENNGTAKSATTPGVPSEKTVEKGGWVSIFQPKEIKVENFSKNGVPMKRITSGVSYNDIDRHFSPINYINGEGNIKPDRAAQALNTFKSDPSFSNPQNIEDINLKIDAYNKAQGLNPNNIGSFIPPIGQANPDGSVAITATPLQFVKAIAAAYSPTPTSSEVVDEKLMKGFVDKSNIAQNYGSADQAHAAASRSRFLNWMDKEKLPLELDKLQSEIDKNNRKGSIGTSQGLEATKSVMNLIGATNKQHFYNLDDTSKVSSDEKDKFINPALIRQVAGVSDNALIRVVPLGDPAVQKGMQMPELENGKVASITKPLKAFMIKDGDNVKFIGLYKGLEKDNKNKVSIQVFDPGNMASNFISAENNFATTNQDEEAKNAAYNYFNQLNGAPIQNNQSGVINTAQNSSGRAPGIYNIKGKNYYWDGKQLTEQ